MTNPKIIILADDLTGAADTCLPFAGRGMRTIIHTSLSPVDAEAAVIVTRSRHLDAQQSHSANAAAAQYISAYLHNTLVYQKIDSTLRGHPEAALMATMATLKADRTLVAPAFPAQGRTTLQGCQFIHGVRLEASAFGGEVHEADLRKRFHAYSDAVHWLALDEIRAGSTNISKRMHQPGIYVADAESQDDLLILAQAGRMVDIRLYCGSAGLAYALAEPGEAPALSLSHQLARSGNPALIVAGSRHPDTIRQISYSEKCGTQVVYLTPAELNPASADGISAIERIKTYMLTGHDLIVTTARMPTVDPVQMNVAGALGNLIYEVMQIAPVGGLVLTGGDVALSVCDALQVSQMQVLGEIEPGVVLGVLLDGDFPGLPVVTKAGGFGSDHILRSATDSLSPNSPLF